MNITRENYEAFFLDYYEGSLSQNQEAELVDFLQLNKDLKEEFDAFQILCLEEDSSVVFGDTDLLKKPFDTSISGPVKEKHLIAWHEGDLKEEEKVLVSKAIAEDDKLHKDFMLFGMTRLEADASIVYSGKSALKHYTIGQYFPAIRKLAAAAAVIAIISTLYFMLPDLTTKEQVAEVIPETSVPAETQNTIESKVPEVVPARENTPIVTKSPSNITLAERTVKESTPVTMPERTPMQVAQIEPINQAHVATLLTQPLNIDQRTEFYWLTYASGFDETEEEQESDNIQLSDPSKRYTSLASLAYDGIERTTGFDVENFQEQVAEKRLGFWDLAGYSLAGIGQLTGTPLTINKERDENGRITSFGIGERFKIKR